MGIAVWRGYTKKAAPAPAVFLKNDVNFYDDYAGTLVASYSAADFANLSALPANPSHSGVVAEGWNWTLADAKTYVAANGKLNIGQMYRTESGKTEYDVEINEATGMTATLTGTSGTEKDWGDGTIDTNETHTYALAGDYTIKLSGTTLPSIQGSKKVRAVRIASGVTSIASYSFLGCYLLQSVTIPSSVTSIGSGAFTNSYALQSVTIPSSITSIGSSAFSSCCSLQHIAISNSVTSIGDSALQNCSTLQSVTIPSSITSIGSGALQGCDCLRSVVIPSSVTSIGSSAFSSCVSLQAVVIPSSVTSIIDGAFQSCVSLQAVVIPSSVTSIGNSAFRLCNFLGVVTVLATTPPTLAATNAIPNNVKKIYIPNGTLAAYQAATNWSFFSSKFAELPA